MSRSIFSKTSSTVDNNETSSISQPVVTTTTTTATTATNNDQTRALRFHHRLMPTISSSHRSNETVPVIVVQSSSMLTPDLTTNNTNTNSVQHKSIVRLNPKIKRNLRDKRRSTGIKPDEVTSASNINDSLGNDDDEAEDNPTTCNQYLSVNNAESCDTFESNPLNTSKPIFTVSRIQPTFDEKGRQQLEKLTITRPDTFTITSPPPPIYPNPSTHKFRSEEFILRRQPSDDESSAVKRRQLEERIRTLESLVCDKDAIIQDLQRKIDKATRDLNEAEQQIYILQRDKLTLIKSFSSLQDAKPNTPNEHTASSKRTGYLTRK